MISLRYLLLALGLSTSAHASLLGNSVNFATSATGGTTAGAPGSLTAIVVDPGLETTFCVGPNADGCIDSGLSVLVDVTGSGVSFTFWGGTQFAIGSFTFVISGIDVPVLAVTQTGGSLFLGTFGLSSFDSTSITFVGSTTSVFSGSGNTVTFAIDTQPAPEPTTLGLSGAGLALLAWQARRRSGLPAIRWRSPRGPDELHPDETPLLPDGRCPHRHRAATQSRRR